MKLINPSKMWQSSNIRKLTNKIAVMIKLKVDLTFMQCLLPFGSESTVFQTTIEKRKD